MTDFIGFNTVDKKFPPFTLTDVELVKRDLLNEFYTRLGERVMKPTFGTIIFDLLMEPSDQVTRSAIVEDAIRIVKKEPRLTLNNVEVQEFIDAIIVELTVTYAPQNLTESLYVTYQREAGNENTNNEIIG